MSNDIRLYDVEQEAISDLVDRINDLIQDNDILEADQIDNEYHSDLCEIIFEVTDSAVPIYTGDILQLAADNLYLATEEPKLGPAFDGSPTPANIIAANIFEHIEGCLWEYVRDDLENDSRIKYSAMVYTVEPEIPIDAPEWAAYDSTYNDVWSQFDKTPASFWEAFEACILDAIDNERESIVVEWKITEGDVNRWNHWRNNTAFYNSLGKDND